MFSNKLKNKFSLRLFFFFKKVRIKLLDYLLNCHQNAFVSWVRLHYTSNDKREFSAVILCVSKDFLERYIGSLD